MGVTYTETAEAPENISSEEKTSCECIEGESKNEFRSTSKLRKTFIQLFSADHKMPNSLIPEKNEDVKGHKQKMRRSRVFRFPCLRSAEKREKLKRTRKNDSHCTEQGGSGSYYKASLLRKHRLKSEVEMTSKFIEERTEEPQACELHKKLLGKDNIKNESRKEDLKDILKKNIVDRCEVQEGRMPRDCSENKNSLARDSVIDIQETGSARNMDMKNSLVEQERQTELGESNKVKYCLTPRKSGSKEYYLNSNQRLENSLTRHSEFKEDKIQCTDLKEKETHEEIMDWVKEPFTQGGQEAFQLQNNFQENEIQQTEICDDQQVIKDKIIFNNSDSKSIKEATCKTERLIQSEEKQAQPGKLGLPSLVTKGEQSPPCSPKGKEIVLEDTFSNQYKSTAPSGHLGKAERKIGDSSVVIDNSSIAMLEKTGSDSTELCEEIKLDPIMKQYSNKEPNSDHKSSQEEDSYLDHHITHRCNNRVFEDTRWKTMREEVETMVHLMMKAASQKLSHYTPEPNT